VAIDKLILIGGFYPHRVKASGDEMEEEEVKQIVSSIEHEMYKYHGDTGSKYKSRYRSLLFNVNDAKNNVSTINLSS